MPKLISRFNTFLVLLALLCGCQTPNSKTLKINVGGEPHSLDPRKARDLQAQTIVQMFFDGLTRLDKTEHVQLAIAERVDVSEDGKLYTFHLRPSKWSNGDFVTAEDFVYAYKTALKPAFPSPRAFQLYVIKNAELAKTGKISVDEVGIRAVSDSILEIALENPTPFFLEMLSLPIFYPVNCQVDQIKPEWADSAANYVGNGPFLPRSWKHSDCIEAMKNPIYWDEKQVQLDSLQLVMVSEETEYKMFEKKELDWAGSPLSILPLDALPELKQKDELKAKPFLATYFFRINTEKPPFSHPQIRKAFALALNRQEIVQHILNGQQTAATALIPPAMGVSNEPYFQDGDEKMASQLFEKYLKELRLARSSLPKVSLLYVTGERNNLIAQAVQQQWYKVFGIEVSLEPVERKTFYERTSKQNFQMAIGSWSADFNDPSNFLEVFKSKEGGSNNTGWHSSRYADLLTLAGTISDPEERTSLYQECEQILMDEMPIIPIFHYNLLYVSNDRVHDVVLSKLGNIDFKWARIVTEKETK